MAWQFESGLPIYRQLVDRIRMMIAGGEFKPGDRIPAVRELALEAGVNPNTMQKALAQLEKDGLIFSQRSAGRFVTQDGETLRALRQELGKGYISTMFENLRKLGLSDQEILKAVREHAAEGEEV